MSTEFRSKTVERLLKLADHIEKLPPERFDMEMWGLRAKDENDCGAVCCAFGHACSIPEFRQAGLKLEWEDEGDSEASAFPVFGTLSGWEAAEAFFGLTEEQTLHLFDDRAYEDDPTPAVVAARLREFARSGS